MAKRLMEFRISIHALLAESDNKISAVRIARENFYPRSPCGERLVGVNSMLTLIQFLSTLSLRRATTLICEVIAVMTISIHALLAESDSMLTILCCGCFDFYPRSPCGERQPGARHANSQQEFLSTLSLRRATTSNLEHPEPSRFLSTLSLRRATGGGHINKARSKHFYPRSPCGERLLGNVAVELPT